MYRRTPNLFAHFTKYTDTFRVTFPCIVSAEAVSFLQNTIIRVSFKLSIIVRLVTGTWRKSAGTSMPEISIFSVGIFLRRAELPGEKDFKLCVAPSSIFHYEFILYFIGTGNFVRAGVSAAGAYLWLLTTLQRRSNYYGDAIKSLNDNNCIRTIRKISRAQRRARVSFCPAKLQISCYKERTSHRLPLPFSEFRHMSLEIGIPLDRLVWKYDCIHGSYSRCAYFWQSADDSHWIKYLIALYPTIFHACHTTG